MLPLTVNLLHWCLCCSGQPHPCSQEQGAVSGLGLTVLFVNLSILPADLRSTQQGGQPDKEQEKDGVRAQTWALRHARTDALWVGPRHHKWFGQVWTTTEEMLILILPFAELEGRGIMGEGQRKMHTHTQTKSNLLWKHSKCPVGSLITSSQGQIKLSFSALLSSSYTVCHGCFTKHVNQKIQNLNRRVCLKAFLN